MDQGSKHVDTSLTHFFDEALPSISEDYRWPPKGKPADCPFDGYQSAGSSNLETVLHQRRFLASLWAVDPTQRLRIASWVIRDWGGVRGNAPETIRRYASTDSGELIGAGITGIASWSKVLAVADPCRFAIYDARVAVSLNAIQLVYGGNQLHHGFPLLPSQNKRIVAFGKRLRQRADWMDASALQPAASAYQSYLDHLHYQAKCRGESLDWQILEMALFSHAERLLERAVPN